VRQSSTNMYMRNHRRSIRPLEHQFVTRLNPGPGCQQKTPLAVVAMPRSSTPILLERASGPCFSPHYVDGTPVEKSVEQRRACLPVAAVECDNELGPGRRLQPYLDAAGFALVVDTAFAAAVSTGKSPWVKSISRVTDSYGVRRPLVTRKACRGSTVSPACLRSVS
jgi:hypothetical protein